MARGLSREQILNACTVRGPVRLDETNEIDRH